jgi:DNA-binding HxlR family transcriptional regulator
MWAVAKGNTVPKVAVDVGCKAFQSAIDVLGRPWNAQILGALQGRTLRYSELAEAVEGVGDKILSARLKDLEKRELLARRVDPGPPVKVAYALTAKGDAFRQVADAISKWGATLVSGK